MRASEAVEDDSLSARARPSVDRTCIEISKLEPHHGIDDHTDALPDDN